MIDNIQADKPGGFFPLRLLAVGKERPHHTTLLYAAIVEGTKNDWNTLPSSSLQLSRDPLALDPVKQLPPCQSPKPAKLKETKHLIR